MTQTHPADEREANLALHLGDLNPGWAAMGLTYHTSRRDAPNPELLHCDQSCSGVGPGSAVVVRTTLEIRADGARRECMECYHWSAEHENGSATYELLAMMVEAQEAPRGTSDLEVAELLDTGMRLQTKLDSTLGDPIVQREGEELSRSIQEHLDTLEERNGPLSYVWVGRRWSGPYSVDWAQREGVTPLLAAAAAQLHQSTPRPRIVVVPEAVARAACVEGFLHLGPAPEKADNRVLETYTRLVADEGDTNAERSLVLLELARTIHH